MPSVLSQPESERRQLRTPVRQQNHRTRRETPVNQPSTVQSSQPFRELTTEQGEIRR